MTGSDIMTMALCSNTCVCVCVCVCSYVLGVLHPEDLLPEVLEVVEGRLGRDGVDESEALTVLHVQVSHRRELLLQTDRGRDRQVVRERETGGEGDRQTGGEGERDRW